MRQRGQPGRSTPRELAQDGADAELATRAAGGDIEAFDELYRRHVQTAWRVAQAVTGNPHDAADAVSEAFTRVFQALPSRLEGGGNFRPYLLASVRNAAIDVLRRAGRTSPSDNEELLDKPVLGSGPSDLLVADVNSSMVADAFRSLPERWRTVLWLTEVEGLPPREVAVLLGVSANGVAQLAVRARAGLRERFLQAHLRQGEVRKECRAAVANLGAYAAGGLAPRDISKVDQHLAGCEACRNRLGELQELGQTLQRSVLPLPLALAAAGGAGRWLAASSGGGKLTTGAGAGAGGAAAKAGAGAGTAAAKAGAGAVAAKAGAGVGAVAATSAAGGSASLAVASVALLAAGLLGVGAVDTSTQEPRPQARPSASASPLTSEADPGAAATAAALADYPLAGMEVPEAPQAPVRSRRQLRSPAGAVGAAPDATSGAQQALPAVEPIAQLGMWLPGPLAVVLALGETAPVCAGAEVAGTSFGCATDPPPEGGGVTVGAGGTIVPETHITVPPDPSGPVSAPSLPRPSIRSSVDRDTETP